MGRIPHERPDAPASDTPPPEPPDIHEIMGRMSDAISAAATAATALVGSQEREGSSAGVDVGDEIATLVHGVQCVRKAYDDLDVATRELQS